MNTWTHRSLTVLAYLFQMEGWQLRIPPPNPHLGQPSPFLFRSLLYRLLMLAALFATDVPAVQSWRFVTVHCCETVKGFNFCHSIACFLSCLKYHKMITFHYSVLSLFIKSHHKLNRLLNINYNPLLHWPPKVSIANVFTFVIIIFCAKYRIYSRNSLTFLTKILYLNLGCVIYARKRFYVGWGCLLSGVSLTVFLGLMHSCPYVHPVSFKQACTNISQSGSENSFSRFWK